MASTSVSVVIPAYNVADYIAQAVESVLNQSYEPAEVIVVDDGSTDGTREVLEAYSTIRVITQPNGGPAVARNSGVRDSRGQLLAFLDADDLWQPDKIARQVELLDEHADVDGAFTLIRHFVDDGLEAPASLRPHLLNSDAVGYTLSTFLVRRRAFDRVGYFSPGHEAEDAGLTFDTVREPLVLKRARSGSISEKPTRLLHGVLTAARDSIARRRETVTVMIAAYNGAAYLEEAIQSVLDQDLLDQGESVEVIVVDDGSIDETRTIVRRHPSVKYVYQENAGTAAALNTALEQARGGYFAFLDQDDVWAPGKLGLQLSVMRERSDVEMVQGRLRQFVSPEIDERDRDLFVGDGRIEPARYVVSQVLFPTREGASARLSRSPPATRRADDRPYPYVAACEIRQS
ncbi:MAG: glycosyltransferase family 2 protein [Rhodothermia bacterium]